MTASLCLPVRALCLQRGASMQQCSSEVAGATRYYAPRKVIISQRKHLRMSTTAEVLALYTAL
jgi:hypothetical protein